MKKPFLSYFRTMNDHRINRKKLHPLENIVAIAIVAIICNMETWEEGFSVQNFSLINKIVLNLIRKTK